MSVRIIKFLKRRSFDLMLYAWVDSLRFNLPSISIEKAVRQFLDYHDIGEDEVNLQTAVMTFKRMSEEYRDLKKSEVN